jgi:hypothetical protein
MTKVILTSDKDLFIVKGEDNSHFEVIRPVPMKQLEEMRTLEGCKDYHKDVWVSAVQSDSTEESLDDFCQSLLDDLDANDEEDFPFKDSRDTEILEEIVNGTSETLRTIVDNFIQTAFDYEVGTWESSGMYPPKEDEIVAVFYVDK